MRALLFFEFGNFRFGGGDLLLELGDFLGIVHLFFRSGQSRTQLLDLFSEYLSSFLRFFIHFAVSLL